MAHDLRADPYLPYILLLATVLAGFWFWHLVPNFATRDEYGRLQAPLSAAGHFVADPGLEGLRAGLGSNVALGATTYLYGLVLLPIFVAIVVTGQLDAFASATFGTTSEYGTWQALPEWFWTWSILLMRATNVIFAVGCVYLTYRIGTTMRNRATGRLAAVFLTFTFGFLTLAHEGGEDMPAAFFVLAVVYLGIRYIETGERALLLASCALGGAAIAFKFTAAPVVGLIAVAHVLRARRADASWVRTLVRPRLIGTGMLIGAVTILLAFPSLFIGRPEVFLDRLMQATERSTASRTWGHPISWWYLHGYLGGFGLPLFIGVVGGDVASIPRLRNRSFESDVTVLLLAGVALFVPIFSTWRSLRIHHLLPTFPLLILMLAATLTRLHTRRPSVARPLVAVLLLTSGTYAVVGDVGYAIQPHDRATDWLATNTDDNATMEVYMRDVHDGAIPHGMRAYNYETPGLYPTDGANQGELTQEEWMLNMPNRCPDYIQLPYRVYFEYDPQNWRSGTPVDRYLHNLRVGDEYPYQVVVEFGEPPRYLQNTTGFSERLPELLRAGLFPRSLQYGGEQYLSDSRQYVAILERTGPCG